MIQPRFSRYAERFLDLQNNQTRKAIIDLIVEICREPRLDPSNPDSRKRVYRVPPAIFTKYLDDDWWVIYQVVTYPQEESTFVIVANIGEAEEPQALLRPLG